MRLIKKIIETSEKLGDSPQQSDVYKFKLNNEWFVLKLYKHYENNAGEILSQLHHPNIVELFGTGRYRGREYVIMEFIEGLNIDQQGIITDSQVLQLKNVLQYLKNNKVHHREFKPEHLLITPEGMLKLIDFGMASTPEFELKVKPQDLEINKDYGTNDDIAVQKIIEKYGVKK